MFGWLKKKNKLFEARIIDRAKEDKSKIRMTLLGGTTAVLGSLSMLPAIGPLAYLGVAVGVIATGVRTGIYLDFYSRRMNEDGKGNWFTKKFQPLWAKSPLHHLSIWKIENDRRDDALRLHFSKLSSRINGETDAETKKALEKDFKAYEIILDKIYPNRNLMSAAAGGLGAMVSWRHLVKNIAANAPWYNYPLAGAGTIFSASYAAMNLSVYTIKKIASATRNPLFDRIHAAIERTPMRHVTTWMLGRQMKHLDKLEISEILTQDLVDLSLDKNLQILTERSGYPAKGMLKKLFSVAANEAPEDAIGIPDISIEKTQENANLLPSPSATLQ